jgi:hypothetical protein
MANTTVWGNLADDVIDRFAELDGGQQLPFHYAFMFSAVGQRQGWDSELAQHYLAKLKALKLYSNGVFQGWTSFRGGTLVYSITLADHIGPCLLEAYLNGAPGVTAQDVIDIGVLLMNAPRSYTTLGWGISYLAHVKNTTNVLNLTAATAMFLKHCQQAGLDIPASNGSSADTFIMQLGKYFVQSYNPTVHNWPYSSIDPAVNDCDHLSLLVEAATVLAPALARHVGVYVLLNNYPSTEPNRAFGHMRVGGLCPILGVDLADSWLTEAQTYYGNRQNEIAYLPQIARWTARIANT